MRFVRIEIIENGDVVYEERLTKPLNEKIHPYTLCLMISGLLHQLDEETHIKKGEGL